MNVAVCRQYSTAGSIKGRGCAVPCSQKAAGFLQDQPAGRIVPGFKAVFHVCIQTTAGRIAQLYGSCTDPTYIVAAVIDTARPGKGSAGFLTPPGIGPHRAQAVRQAPGGAGMDGPAVAEGPTAAPGGKQFPRKGVVYK